jgi:hypothetical protein
MPKKRRNKAAQANNDSTNFEWESRKILFEASFKETSSLTSNITTLSTAFLGTILIFFEKLHNGIPVDLWLLYLGASTLVACIILVLVFRIIKLNSIDCSINDETEKCDNLTRISTWMREATVSFFIVGIISITLFLSNNLSATGGTMSKEPQKPTQRPSTGKPLIQSPKTTPSREAKPATYNPNTVRPPKPTKPNNPK